MIREKVPSKNMIWSKEIYLFEKKEEGIYKDRERWILTTRASHRGKNRESSKIVQSENKHTTNQPPLFQFLFYYVLDTKIIS